MDTLSSDMYDLPETPSDARIVELAAQVRALQAELRRQEASATENAKLFAQAHARLRELSALNKVSRAVISTLDVQELLRVALQQTVQVTDADTGSIMLMDTATRTLKIAVAHGLSSEVIKAASVAMGEGVAGRVAQTRKPLLVPNVANDPRFQLIAPRTEIKSAMSVPIMTRYEVLGVLNIARTNSTRPFSTQDLQLLGTLAGQISLAIENARLFEAVNRRNEELSILMELGHQLNSTLNLREVLDIIVDQACSIIRADACALFLLDDRQDTLRARAMRNLSNNFLRKVRGKLGHGLLGDVAVSGIPEYVEDVALSPRLEYADIQAAEGLKSMLCAPLRTGGQSLGALAVFSRTTRHWEDHEMNMLMALAGQSAMAINNAENYQYQRGIAELVQKNLVPRVQLGDASLDVGHKYLPAKQVGGDYYDLFHLTDGRVGFLIADVAGKSVQAAVHTAKGKYFIRALGHDNPSPSDVIARTNRLIHEDTMVETFISAFYAVLDPDGRTLRFCNAGHPPPLLLKADGTIHELDQPDILLGILPDPEFHEETVHLDPGDSIVLTTDGVTEARGEDCMYGQTELMRCLSEHTDVDAQTLADCIAEDVIRFAGKRMRDDIAILVIRIP